jgi:Flp pilus assembly protein TadD/glycosyltransferase involved in cell wall biosynthesis
MTHLTDDLSSDQLLDVAAGLLRRGSIQDAEKVCQKVLFSNTTNSGALHLLGLCQYQIGDLVQAIALIARAVELSPRDPVMANNLGAVLLAYGQPESALAAFDRALACKPAYGEAWNNRGNALVDLTRFDAALEAYRHADAILTGDPNVTGNLGQVLMRLDRPREALVEYLRTLAVAPDNKVALCGLHMARHLAMLSCFDSGNVENRCVADAIDALNGGRYSDAILLLDRVAEDFPDVMEGLVFQGVAHYLMGSFQDAQMSFSRVPLNKLAPSQIALYIDYKAKTDAAIALQGLRGVLFDPQRDLWSDRMEGDDRVHLVSTFGNRAGTELHTLILGGYLRQWTAVSIWASHGDVHESFGAEDIQRIDESTGNAPSGGTLLFLGAWQAVGKWYGAAHFRRVIVLYNVEEPAHLARIVRDLALPGKPKVELVFVADWLRKHLGIPGTSKPSPIDIDVFQPVHRKRSRGQFVVGRLSRDERYKFHPGASAFFSRLADSGTQVRLMGATVLGTKLGSHPSVEVLAAGAIPASDFLQHLDCFVYRTHTCFRESWGRVVTEAMACGLPVVVHAVGGYGQIIEHGKNGFVFRDDDEAFDLILALKECPDLCCRMGEAARRTIEAILSPEACRRHYQFYLD